MTYFFKKPKNSFLLSFLFFFCLVFFSTALYSHNALKARYYARHYYAKSQQKTLPSVSQDAFEDGDLFASEMKGKPFSLKHYQNIFLQATKPFSQKSSLIGKVMEQDFWKMTEGKTYHEIQQQFLDFSHKPFVYEKNPLFSRIGSFLEFYHLPIKKIVDLTEALFYSYHIPDALVLHVYLTQDEKTVNQYLTLNKDQRSFSSLTKDGRFYFTILLENNKKLFFEGRYDPRIFPYFPFHSLESKKKVFLGLFLPKKLLFSKKDSSYQSQLETIFNVMQKNLSDYKTF